MVARADSLPTYSHQRVREIHSILNGIEQPIVVGKVPAIAAAGQRSDTKGQDSSSANAWDLA